MVGKRYSVGGSLGEVVLVPGGNTQERCPAVGREGSPPAVGRADSPLVVGM